MNLCVSVFGDKYTKRKANVELYFNVYSTKSHYFSSLHT